MARIFQFRIEFEVLDKPLIITAWSGSFLLRIIYEIFHRVNIDFEKKVRKPFIIEPLIYNGKYLLSGLYIKKGSEFKQIEKTFSIIEPGSKFLCNMYIFDLDLISKFMEAIVQDQVINLPGTSLMLSGVNIDEVELPEISISMSGESWHSIHVDIEFLSPTAFMLHGNDILTPSPVRLVYNIAKIYYELTGINLKNVCNEIPKVMDLHRIKKLNYYFVDIGESRKVPTFMGKVTYVIAGKTGIVYTILQLLKIGTILGVGISRTLGFGRIKISRIVEK